MCECDKCRGREICLLMREKSLVWHLQICSGSDPLEAEVRVRRCSKQPVDTEKLREIIKSHEENVPS